jgi:hypothetical protein
MAQTGTPTAIERLAQVKDSPDCVTYGVDIAGTGKLPYWFSLYGVVTTGEIFVEVTKDRETRVQSFISRHKSCPPEDRRAAMTLVDSADGYELARRMVRYWPRKTLPPFP